MTQHLTPKMIENLRLIAKCEVRDYHFRGEDRLYADKPGNPQIKALLSRGLIVAIGTSNHIAGGEVYQITTAGKEALAQSPLRDCVKGFGLTALKQLKELEAEIGSRDWLTAAIKECAALRDRKEIPS